MAGTLKGIGIRCHQAGLVLEGRQVLGPLDLCISAGEGVVLLGSNGAGKTQLLKLLAGERWPTPTSAGDELREYQASTGEPIETTEVLPQIAFIGGERQDRYYRYDWNFSVQRVVATGVHNTLRPTERLSPRQRAHVRGLLKRFDLARLARRRFLTLSYGERRRVLIARALAGTPLLILLDEVHNGLDAVTRKLLDAELNRLARRGVTRVMAAHRADDIPAHFARALVLESGNIRYDGPVASAPRTWLALNAEAAPVSISARPSTEGPLIEVRSGAIFRDYRPVIQNLDWTVGPGEHWAILGANGSGKSTLLQAVYGLLPFAAHSEVTRRGYAQGMHIEEWRRRLGYVSPELQTEYLDDLDVMDFVVSGERLSYGLLMPADTGERRRARTALDLVGFTAARKGSVRQLSYGQRRLALFARALVNRPEALLLDEPLTGLDAPYRAKIRSLLSALAQSGVQLLVAAHHATDLVPEIRHILDIRKGAGRVRLRDGVAKRGRPGQSRTGRDSWPVN
jgi:molybdate transport system ATP-binding protein